MKPLSRLAVIFCLAATGASPLPAQDRTHLYKTTMLQAAPGRLLELMDLVRRKIDEDIRAGEPEALWIRHSQGDRWDLLVLTPMGTYTECYSGDRPAKRRKAAEESGWTSQSQFLIAHQEDIFVFGPQPEDLRAAFIIGGFFHVEMFAALPGQRRGLIRQREMENTYLRHLHRPENFIFVRDQGAAWDVFTLGVYKDLKHYAASADIPQKEQDEAARVAGFTSASQIGPYLRQFIQLHHDTLAVLPR